MFGQLRASCISVLSVICGRMEEGRGGKGRGGKGRGGKGREGGGREGEVGKEGEGRGGEGREGREGKFLPMRTLKLQNSIR